MIQIRTPKRRNRCRGVTTILAPRVLDEHPTESGRSKSRRDAEQRSIGAGSPRERVLPPSPRQVEEHTRPISTAPILVVDDDPSILATIREFLELEGYTVEVARNGAEALDSISRLLPSLVLLDMRMPVLDGWAFARQLRERGISLPVVVMTAAWSARSWAEEIGADAYLAKPFELLDLLDIVERYRREPSTDPDT